MPDTERKATTTHAIQYDFYTDQMGDDDKPKNLTKSFSGINTALADDRLSAVGHALVNNKIFGNEEDNGVIDGLDKITRIDTTKTPVDLSSIMPAEETQTA